MLSKIAVILSFTGAALALTGMLCGIVWRGGFVALGVLLILASPVLRYGAELELQLKQEHSS